MNVAGGLTGSRNAKLTARYTAVALLGSYNSCYGFCLRGSRVAGVFSCTVARRCRKATNKYLALVWFTIERSMSVFCSTWKSALVLLLKPVK